MHKTSGLILFLLVVSLLAVSTGGALAQSGNPTPAVAGAQAQQTTGLPWYVGVLILLAVFVGVTVFKNRYQATQKKPVLNTACCVPIIEEGGPNPFAIIDDESEKKP